jgi:hypothetical protein
LDSGLSSGSSFGLLLSVVSRFGLNELVVVCDQRTIRTDDSICYLPENGIW